MIVKFGDQTIVNNLKIADNFFSRFVGLMGTKELKEGEGLLIKPCNGVHMFWMRYGLDIVFLDKDYRVVHLIENLRPWKISSVIRQAYMVLEVPIGTIKKYNIKKQEKIFIPNY